MIFQTTFTATTEDTNEGPVRSATKLQERVCGDGRRRDSLWPVRTEGMWRAGGSSSRNGEENRGRDTFVALKEINPKVRAILSSGYALGGEAQEIMDLGVRAFIGKPYGVRDLSKTVTKVLGE